MPAGVGIYKPNPKPRTNGAKCEILTSDYNVTVRFLLCFARKPDANTDHIVRFCSGLAGTLSTIGVELTTPGAELTAPSVAIVLIPKLTPAEMLLTGTNSLSNF